MFSVGLIGEPAVGKTTAIRELIDGMHFTQHKLGTARWMQCEEQELILIGTYVGHTFDGTDRLSMSCYSDLETMLQYFQQSDSLCSYGILWEGDRLARKRWLGALAFHGYHLLLLHLVADLKTVEQRRCNRGTKQNETWVTGRRNLCKKLAKEHKATHVIMDEDYFKVAEELLMDKDVGVVVNRNYLQEKIKKHLGMEI